MQEKCKDDLRNKDENMGDAKTKVMDLEKEKKELQTKLNELKDGNLKLNNQINELQKELLTFQKTNEAKKETVITNTKAMEPKVESVLNPVGEDNIPSKTMDVIPPVIENKEALPSKQQDQVQDLPLEKAIKIKESDPILDKKPVDLGSEIKASIDINNDTNKNNQNLKEINEIKKDEDFVEARENRYPSNDLNDDEERNQDNENN